MQQLSPAGEQIINDIAQRHAFSPDGVRSMLYSVINGNGSMAQFGHPDFSGSGQWMRGGMTMVSDMFNNQLKGRIDSLCNELSNLIASQPDLVRRGSFQSQSQGGQEQTNISNNGESSGGTSSSSQQQDGSGPIGPVSLFVAPAPGTSADWWPNELRLPNSTGSQNGARYAYFAKAQQLAIEVNGRVTVYDTLDHQIGGFSQQQSIGGSMSFNSQHGLINVASLPVISVDGVAQNARTQHTPAAQSAAQPATQPAAQPATQQATRPAASIEKEAPVNTPADVQGVTQSNDIFATIEKLATLFDKGILSKTEYETKKAELLSRL
ncbi:MAG: SHOCT domain-containing protein [Burkholderiaceae bacterium]